MAVACFDPAGPVRRWYVLKVKPNKEQYVQFQLGSCSGIETYCPRIKTAKRDRVKYQREIEPVFPGYVFVRMDLERDQLTLKRLNGHTGLVAFDGRPASVADELIEDFRRRERRGFLVHRPEAALRPNDRVRVVSGPFLGRTGVFLRYANSAERVCLLLEMMRSERPVELPRTAVQAVAV